MLIKDADLIPDWLKVHLVEPCPYCGSDYQVDYSPNGQRVTKHYCPNEECPGTVAAKMVFVWEVLKVDGIKFGRSLELVKQKNIKHHLDAIPYLFKDAKPTVDVGTFMRLQCINGIDDSWYSVCENTSSIDEVLNKSITRKFLNESDIKRVYSSMDYFNIVFPKKQAYEPILTLTVMMTGDIMGLDNRELLIQALNERYKGLLDLRYSKSIRRTGISYLIKDDGSTITRKVTTAKECGIPIITPNEFCILVDKLIREKAGDVI